MHNLEDTLHFTYNLYTGQCGFYFSMKYSEYLNENAKILYIILIKEMKKDINEFCELNHTTRNFVMAIKQNFCTNPCSFIWQLLYPIN